MNVKSYSNNYIGAYNSSKNPEDGNNYIGADMASQILREWMSVGKGVDGVCIGVREWMGCG